MTRLSGWQRLFVVVSFLCFVPVVVAIAVVFVQGGPASNVLVQLEDPRCVRFGFVEDASVFEGREDEVAKGKISESKGARPSRFRVRGPDGREWIVHFQGELSEQAASPIAIKAAEQVAKRNVSELPAAVLPTGLVVTNVPLDMSDRALLERVLAHPERMDYGTATWSECSALVSFWFESGVAALDPATYRRTAQQLRIRAAVEVAVYAVALWAAICLLLYVSGWTVAWIRRGFREQGL